MMSAGEKVVFTKAGKERLDALVGRFRDEAIATLSDRGYVPGEDFVEVTASDVDDLRRTMPLPLWRSGKRASRMFRLISRVYAVFGLLLVAAGAFYPWFMDLFNDPVRTALILCGTALSVFSALYVQFLSFREADQSQLDPTQPSWLVLREVMRQRIDEIQLIDRAEAELSKRAEKIEEISQSMQ